MSTCQLHGGRGVCSTVRRKIDEEKNYYSGKIKENSVKLEDESRPSESSQNLAELEDCSPEWRTSGDPTRTPHRRINSSRAAILQIWPTFLFSKSTEVIENACVCY